MKKRQVNIYAQTNPYYVIAHAKWRKNRGRRQPSAIYRNERNPQKALTLAKWDIESTKEITKVDESQWSISFNNATVAKIHLDHEGQTNTVVFLDQNKRHQRKVKELALSHAIQFVIRRSPMPKYLIAILPKRDLEEYTSDNLMDFKKIPDAITFLNNEDLDKYLSGFANFVEGRFTTPENMLDNLMMDIREKLGILIKLKEGKWMDNDHITATFECTDENNFKVWNACSDGPGSSWRLHFTAPYHPVMDSKKQSFCMINGSTDYYIRGGDEGIRHVYSPEDARTNKDGFGTSWSYLKHPFYAEGKTLGVEFSATLCMAKSGYQTLYNLLSAALNRNNLYVSVNGGFNSPYDYPENILNRKGMPSPAGNQGGGHTVRGSEDDCVWEYRTLKKEGQLKNSLAPDWFFPEGWLDIYKGERKKF